MQMQHKLEKFNSNWMNSKNCLQEWGEKKRPCGGIVLLVWNYDIVAITEKQWDELHNCSAVLDGYKLFRRNRLGRRSGVALYVRRDFDCPQRNDGAVSMGKNQGKSQPGRYSGGSLL